MSTPPFAPLPPANIRLSLAPEEWEACLDAWLTLSELTLRLPASEFSSNASHQGSLSIFLTSFYHELVTLNPQDTTLSNPKALSLRRAAFRLVNRTFEEVDLIAPPLLNWVFLSDLCQAHIKTAALQPVIAKLWKRKSNLLLPSLQKQRDLVIATLESKSLENPTAMLTQLAPLMHASPDAAMVFVTGSDFLDTLVGAYSRSSDDAQKKAMSSFTYLGMVSLVKSAAPNLSLLSDHLYTLKAQADKSPPASSLLVDVVTNTHLVAKLRQHLSGKAPERISKLFDILETYRAPSTARPRKHIRRRGSKGKGKQRQPDAALHVHRMSFVTQIQDLFPDLGSGFVLKLLDEYNDDVEQATAHLLEDSFPSHIASLDRTEQAPVYDSDPQTQIDHLAPRSTPPPETFIPERRNVFDDDELDQLDFDASRLHIGKLNRTSSSGDHPNKAAILSALATFDSDDDERDDTYDVDDVGGTVDTSHPDGEPGPAARITMEANDMALFNAYRSSPELFGRTFDVRKGQARAALKKETGMTDEAIEGWAIMLQRDPKRRSRLETQASAFDGRQTELASTAYRESPGGTETEDSDAPQNGRGGFQGRGRGRGGRGRGRGGSVAGPSGDADNAQAQRRKEASKGSRANHNRRDQRARKMARGGFPG